MVKSPREAEKKVIVLSISASEDFKDVMRNVVLSAMREGARRIRVIVAADGEGDSIECLARLRDVILEHHPITVIVEEKSVKEIARLISNEFNGSITIIAAKELVKALQLVASSSVEVKAV